MFSRNKLKDLLERGSQLLELKNFDGAIECFSKALDVARDETDEIPAFYYRGISYIEKSEDLASNIENDDDEAEIRLIRKYAQLAVKDITEAITNAKIFTPERSGVISDFYVSLSRAHYWLGSPQDVIADANNALQYNGQNGEAYLSRGFVYMEIIGDPSPAIDDFTKALRIQPSAKGYIYRAWAYLDSGKEKDALDDYLRAVRLEPEVKNANRASSIVKYYGWDDFKKKYNRN